MELPLYQQLARHLEHAMQTGSLQPGARLPSVRRLAQQHRVSISTALQVYRQLENQRLIEARPKSGYFVVQPTRAHIPAVVGQAENVDMQERVLRYNRIRRSCHVRFDVAIGELSLYPAQKLQTIGCQILRRHPELISSYNVGSTGYLPLREQIARRLLDAGCTASPEDLLITNGCTEALNLALRALTKPGDTVAVESPVYYGLLEILGSLGLRALEIPTSVEHGISIDALDLVTRPDANPQNKIAAVVTVPNFHNPLGTLMSDENKKRLVELLAARNIPLIEDDIYGELQFGLQRPFSLKSWDTKGNVILCGSASKVLAPNLRVGWILGGRWQERIEWLKFTQSIHTAELPQAIIAEVMRSGSYEHHMRKLRNQFKQQTKQTVTAILRHFPAGTQVLMPQGGFLAWVELPPQVNAWQVFEQAAQDGIGITPGGMFSTALRFENFVRLSCGNPWTPKIEQAIQRLGEIVAKTM